MKSTNESSTLNAPLCPVCQAVSTMEYEHPEAQIFRCAACTHCFSDTRTLTQETYEADYFEITHRNWFQNPNLSLFGQLAKLAKPYGRQARILDVGCGRGDFLFYVREKNSDYELTGVDLAPLAPNQNIRFITADIFTVDFEEKFDLIVTLAVIEHVEQISSFIERLKYYGKPGSTIAIMTLNEESLVYLVAKLFRKMGLMGPFNRLYSRHHLQHYSKASLRRLAEGAGLTVEKQYTHNFPLAAVDFPKKGAVSTFIQMCGVAILFGLGRITNRAFLQTLICRV